MNVTGEHGRTPSRRSLDQQGNKTMQKGFLTDDEVDRAINFGASICKKIKQLSPETTWMKVPSLFDKVKEKGHQYFPDMSYVDMLRSVDHNFSLEDIEDVIIVKHTEKCST